MSSHPGKVKMGIWSMQVKKMIKGFVIIAIILLAVYVILLAPLPSDNGSGTALRNNDNDLKDIERALVHGIPSGYGRAGVP